MANGHTTIPPLASEFSLFKNSGRNIFFAYKTQFR